MSSIGFYDSGPWRRVRKEAMRHCKGWCQICLALLFEPDLGASGFAPSHLLVLRAFV